MASLIFTSGPNAGRRYALEGADLLVGRRSDCHVHIPDLYVSRHHARLRREGSRWIVEDLGSKCGTYVNGERIRRPTVLEDRDELALARSAIRIELPDDQELGIADPELAVIDLDHPRVYVSGGTERETTQVDDPKRIIRLLERQQAALRAILELATPRADPGQIFDALARELLVLFPRARVACVLARDPASGELAIRSLRRRDEASGVTIPRVLLDHLASSSGGVLLGDESMPRATPRDDEPRGARMGAPIRSRGEPFGAIYVESSQRQLRRDDVDLLASIAAQVGLVLDSARMQEELLRRQRLERDLRVARQIQRSLLPGPGGPNIPGLDVAIHYSPAYEVGGDFYDFIWHDERRIALVVGDVSGKAISAALYMARLTSELRSRAGIARRPSQLLAQVNEEMCALGDEGMFATLFYAIYDVESRELVYTNAGHVTPLLRRDGRVIPLHSERAHVPPVGVVTGVAIGEGRVELREGDLLLFTTDGIHEARDRHGTEYGLARLTRRVAAAGAGPEPLIQDVLRDVRDHVGPGPQDDDITVMAVSVNTEACRPGGNLA